MPKPEQSARHTIVTLLTASGRVRQDFKPVEHMAGAGIEVCEVPPKSWPCPYLLLVNCVPVGLRRAEKEGLKLSSIATQSSHCAANFHAFFPAALDCVSMPFRYKSTGVESFHCDKRDPYPLPRRAFSHDAPAPLATCLLEPKNLRGRLGEMPYALPLNTNGIVDCPVEAVVAQEQPLAKEHPRSLSTLADREVDTTTVCTSTYRLTKFVKAKRVLFLVDRANLGRHKKADSCCFPSPATTSFERRALEVTNPNHSLPSRLPRCNAA